MRTERSLRAQRSRHENGARGVRSRRLALSVHRVALSVHLVALSVHLVALSSHLVDPLCDAGTDLVRAFASRPFSEAEAPSPTGVGACRQEMQ
eukprot:9128305-Pyramimonas_sp.AAC.1